MTGRHSTGRNTYALSKGIIGAVVGVILLVAALMWWFGMRNEEAPQPECLRGDLALPIAEEYPGTATELLSAYEANNPMVRDYCVRPQITDSLSDAALYIGTVSPATDQLLSAAHRDPSGDFAAAPGTGSLQVGIYGATAVDPATLDLKDITFPSDTSATTDASVTAALALAPSEAEAAVLLSRDSGLSPTMATTDYVVGTEGSAQGVFSPIAGAELSLRAIVLTPASTGATGEEEARAATDLADSASAQVSTTPSATLYQAAVTPARQPEDTLFLLDASEQMAPYFDEAREAISQAANALAEQGKQVAFWNYSSPLNPGVVNPYRANLDFGAGALVTDVAAQLNTGGVPMTRTATVAAAQAAHDRAIETGASTRLVVVTSGTATGDIDDETFRQQLTATLGDQVELQVVTFGANAGDGALASLATDTGTDVMTAAAL